MNDGAPTPVVLSSERGVLTEGLFVTPDGIRWVDIERSMLWWRTPGGAVTGQHLEVQPSVILDVGADGVRVGDAQGIALVGPHGGVERVASLPPTPPGTRSNDGVLLADGTILLGTMSTEDPDTVTGRLHRFAPGATVGEVFGPPVHIPNAFIPLDRRRVLVADSAVPALLVVDWTSGVVERHPLDMPVRPGSAPDGGCRYGDHALIALWDGWGLASVDLTTGTLLGIIDVPVPRPTNCAIDATSGRVIVTSASEGLDDDELRASPLSGHVLALDPLPTLTRSSG